MQENLNEIIQAYLLNQLPPEEKQAFEQHLADDPAYAAEAAEAATLQAAIQAEGDRELEAKLLTYATELRQMDATLKVSPGTKNNIRKMNAYSRIVYAAAILVGLLVVVLPLWLMNRGSGTIAESPEEIYASNFSIPPLPEARSTGAPELWRQYYSQGDYTAAATELESLLNDPAFTSGRSEAALYLGISRLALGNAAAALEALGNVRAESFDWDAAQWYTALAQLRLGRPEAAKPVLEQISRQKSHPYRQQAARILESL